MTVFSSLMHLVVTPGGRFAAVAWLSRSAVRQCKIVGFLHMHDQPFSTHTYAVVVLTRTNAFQHRIHCIILQLQMLAKE